MKAGFVMLFSMTLSVVEDIQLQFKENVGVRYAEESLPSHFALGPHLVEPLRWRQNLDSQFGAAR